VKSTQRYEKLKLARQLLFKLYAHDVGVLRVI